MTRLVLAPVFAACAVVALWPGVFDLNTAFRGGIAAFFAGRAVVSFLLWRAHRRSDTDGDQIRRGYLLLSYAYVTAGILVGAGALWYGGMPGFVVAYAAFSFAWVWWWIRGTLSRTREERSTP